MRFKADLWLVTDISGCCAGSSLSAILILSRSPRKSLVTILVRRGNQLREKRIICAQYTPMWRETQKDSRPIGKGDMPETISSSEILKILLYELQVVCVISMYLGRPPEPQSLRCVRTGGRL